MDAFIRCECVCGKSHKVPTKFAGKKIKCSECGYRQIVPSHNAPITDKITIPKLLQTEEKQPDIIEKTQDPSTRETTEPTKTKKSKVRPENSTLFNKTKPIAAGWYKYLLSGIEDLSDVAFRKKSIRNINIRLVAFPIILAAVLLVFFVSISSLLIFGKGPSLNPTTLFGLVESNNKNPKTMTSEILVRRAITNIGSLRKWKKDLFPIAMKADTERLLDQYRSGGIVFEKYAIELKRREDESPGMKKFFIENTTVNELNSIEKSYNKSKRDIQRFFNDFPDSSDETVTQMLFGYIYTAALFYGFKDHMFNEESFRPFLKELDISEEDK